MTGALRHAVIRVALMAKDAVLTDALRIGSGLGIDMRRMRKFCQRVVPRRIGAQLFSRTGMARVTKRYKFGLFDFVMAIGTRIMVGADGKAQVLLRRRTLSPLMAIGTIESNVIDMQLVKQRLVLLDRRCCRH